MNDQSVQRNLEEMHLEKPFGSVYKTLLLLGVGVAVLFIYTYFFVDFSRLASVLPKIDHFYLFFSFLVASVGLSLYATAWHYLTKVVGANFSWKLTYPLTLSSVFFNVMIPSASLSGEVYRTYFISKTSFPVEEGVASIILHRIVALLPFIAGLSLGTLLSWLYFPLSFKTFMVLVFVTLISFTALISILLFVFKAEKLVMVVHFIKRVNRIRKLDSSIQRLEDALNERVGNFKRSMGKVKENVKQFIVALISAFLYWFFDVSIMFFLFKGFGITVPFFMVLFVYTLTILLQTIPVMVPGMLGFADMIRTEFFGLMGIPREVALSVSILTDLIVVFYYSFIGFVFLLILNWNYGVQDR